MRFIVVITERAVIARILTHVGLRRRADRCGASTALRRHELRLR